MKESAWTPNIMAASQNEEIVAAIEKERSRLRNFIRKWVTDDGDADDILQEVFYEFVAAYRFMEPIEQAGAWLFRVARNRIIDLFRKRKPESGIDEPLGHSEEGERFTFQDLLPSRDAGPEAEYARSVLLDELNAALDELPETQRDVFVAHELEGRSFKDLAADTGLSVNTLLSRKHYAVQYLRKRLEAIHKEFTSQRGSS